MPSSSPHFLASGMTLAVQAVAVLTLTAALLVGATLGVREVRRQAGIAGYVFALALSLLALVTAYAAR
ncbi:hypothetical protein GCM10022403_079930 [Streptomyces coacervatus]|uniref:Uncharacterized protein n=1 Tax=Streptomyces coacervatus TaxID=647381 RepID=A0ABP7J5I3_9ACTN|nr:hypothetical protein [Streptomyces coacervatus]MDF2269375.1 hypothetical protein [Streptomyces coacervatus]